MSTLRVESIENLLGQEKYMPVLVPAVTATGTSVDFTGIPNWVTKLRIMVTNLSTNGSANIIVQLGSGTVQTTGYTSVGSAIQGAAVGTSAITTNGFVQSDAGAAVYVLHGFFECSKLSGNTWVNTTLLSNTGVIRQQFGAGVVTLVGLLDRVRVTTTNGTDTFDAGSISLMYE